MGEEGGQAESGERETSVGPKLLKPAPRQEGKQAGLRPGLGLPGGGSGRRLFSRRCREATQVSANDLTHCKGGAVERLGWGRSPPFPEIPNPFQAGLRLEHL